MAGILSLPVEVLSDIVMQAIGRPYPNLREAPINISQTCRALREILLSDGQFWSTLFASFDWDEVSSDSDEQFALRRARRPVNIARVAVIWLQRSKDADIKFTLNFSDREVELTAGRRSESDDMMSALCFYQRNWENIVLSGPPMNNYPLILFDIPRLSYLRIATDVLFHPEYPMFPRNESFTQPIFVVAKPVSGASPLAPCLTRMSLLAGQENDKTITGLLEFLRQCPCLHSLEISNYEGSDYSKAGFAAAGSELASTEPVVLQKLHTFSYQSHETHAWLLSWLRTPSLRRLHLSALSHSASWNTESDSMHIAEFLEESKAPIELAIVSDTMLDERAGLRMFNALPSVKVLAFATESHLVIDRVLGKTPTSFCPSLQKVRLGYSPIGRQDDVVSQLQVRISSTPGFEASFVLPYPTDKFQCDRIQTAFTRADIPFNFTLTGFMEANHPCMFSEGVFERFPYLK